MATATATRSKAAPAAKKTAAKRPTTAKASAPKRAATAPSKTAPNAKPAAKNATPTPKKTAPAKSESVFREGISEPGEAFTYKPGLLPRVKYDPKTGIPSSGITEAVVYGTQMCDAVESMGITLPPGFELRLVEAIRVESKTEHSWTRAEQGEDAVTQPNSTVRVQYRFKVEFVGFSQESNWDEIEIIFSRPYSRARLPKGLSLVGDTIVVLFADLQLSKQDKLGGLKATIRRVRSILEQVVQDLRQRKIKVNRIVFADLGDVIEGFTNTSSQLHLNQLSMPKQVSAAINLISEFLMEIRPFAERITYVVVPSNHARWSDGKQLLGKPEDDWGITIAEQAVERLRAAGTDIELVTPDEWEEFVVIEINGQLVGFVHGCQYGPNGFMTWIKGQMYGGTKAGTARIWFTGHYHSAQILNEGVVWVQCPTMDPGSQWFTSKTGKNSKPGMFVATFHADGSFEEFNDLKMYRATTDGMTEKKKAKRERKLQETTLSNYQPQKRAA